MQRFIKHPILLALLVMGLTACGGSDEGSQLKEGQLGITTFNSVS